MNIGETSSAGPSRNPKSAGHKNRGRRKRKGIQHISTLSIKRLARRGGVKRMSKMVYREMKEVLQAFLKKLVTDSIIYCEHDRRKTVLAKDVIQAMKCRGQRIYGFDDAPFPITLRTSIRLTDTESTVTESQLSSAEVTDTPVSPVPGSSRTCYTSYRQETSTPSGNARASSANVSALIRPARNLRSTTTESHVPVSPVPGSSRTCYPSYRQETSTPSGNTRASSANVSALIRPAKNLRSTTTESHVPVSPASEGNRESDQSDSDATVENLDLLYRNGRKPQCTSSARNGNTGTPVTDEDFLINSVSTVENVQISNNDVGTHCEDSSDEIIDYDTGISPVNPFDDNSL